MLRDWPRNAWRVEKLRRIFFRELFVSLLSLPLSFSDRFSVKICIRCHFFSFARIVNRRFFASPRKDLLLASFFRSLNKARPQRQAASMGGDLVPPAMVATQVRVGRAREEKRTLSSIRPQFFCGRTRASSLFFLFGSHRLSFFSRRERPKRPLFLP